MSNTSDLIKPAKDFFDFELILSRPSPVSSLIKSDPNRSVPAYFDKETRGFYLKIEPGDHDFYRTILKAEKEMIVAGAYGSEYLSYPENDAFKSLSYPTQRMLDIPGVIGGSYHMILGQREYWRFLFLREKLTEVSDFLLTSIKEREGNKDAELTIEYLGNPHDLLWFLERHKYSREVVKLKEREELGADYLKNAPIYAHPFHFDLKTMNTENEIAKTIRFSVGSCEPGSTLEGQYTIRKGDLIITEDVRIGRITTEIFDIKKKLFAPALWHSCDYDGKDSFNTYYLDKSDLPSFIRGMNEINEKYRGRVKLIIDSIEPYYTPK